jgi:hypothetical protein
MEANNIFRAFAGNKIIVSSKMVDAIILLVG